MDTVNTEHIDKIMEEILFMSMWDAFAKSGMRKKYLFLSVVYWGFTELRGLLIQILKWKLGMY